MDNLSFHGSAMSYAEVRWCSVERGQVIKKRVGGTGTARHYSDKCNICWNSFNILHGQILKRNVTVLHLKHFWCQKMLHLILLPSSISPDLVMACRTGDDRIVFQNKTTIALQLHKGICGQYTSREQCMTSFSLHFESQITTI